MKTIPIGKIPPRDFGYGPLRGIDHALGLDIDLPEPSEPIPELTMEKALERTGAAHLPAQRGELNALRWFVELAQLDLDIGHAIDSLDFSPPVLDEMLIKQNEFAALERRLRVRQNPPLPSEMDLVQLGNAMREELLGLFHNGRARFIQPAYFDIELPTMPRSSISVDPARHISDFNHAMASPSIVEDKEVGRNGLEREMIGLLKKYVTWIRCCPCCKEMFVKPRQNAGFCSRRCQNAHYMETMRERERLKKRTFPTRPKKATAKVKKGK